MADDFHMVGEARVRGRAPAEAAVPPAAESSAPAAPVVEAAPAAPEVERFDYNVSTGRYHRTSCRFVGATLDLKTLGELAELGAIPCSKCRPPEYAGYGVEA